MAYDLFLIDLDDTLLDFRASERLAFAVTMQAFGAGDRVEALFADYPQINHALWQQFERGEVTKDHLKQERFRQLFARHGMEMDVAKVSHHYLDALPDHVVLVDHAPEICAWLSARGEIGIVTNGIQHVQTRRIQHSAIAPYISFVSVSEACGFAKPDVRFFEHSTGMAKRFSKASALMIGDRMDADIEGAHRFGIDSCWFNPARQEHASPRRPTYEIAHLSELRALVEGQK